MPGSPTEPDRLETILRLETMLANMREGNSVNDTQTVSAAINALNTPQWLGLVS